MNKKVGIKKNKLALKNSEKEEKTDFYKSENFGDVTLHLFVRYSSIESELR